MLKNVLLAISIIVIVLLVWLWPTTAPELPDTKIYYDSAKYYRAEAERADKAEKDLAASMVIKEKQDSAEDAQFIKTIGKWQRIAERSRVKPEVIAALDSLPTLDSLVHAQDSAIATLQVQVDSLKQDGQQAKANFEERLRLKDNETSAVRGELAQAYQIVEVVNKENEGLRKKNKRLKRERNGVLGLWGIREIIGLFR
jgi:hypothetical protein